MSADVDLYDEGPKTTRPCGDQNTAGGFLMVTALTGGCCCCELKSLEVFNGKSKESNFPLFIIHIAFNIQMDIKSCVSMTGFFFTK